MQLRLPGREPKRLHPAPALCLLLLGKRGCSFSRHVRRWEPCEEESAARVRGRRGEMRVSGQSSSLSPSPSPSLSFSCPLSSDVWISYVRLRVRLRACAFMHRCLSSGSRADARQKPAPSSRRSGAGSSYSVLSGERGFGQREWVSCATGMRSDVSLWLLRARFGCSTCCVVCSCGVECLPGRVSISRPFRSARRQKHSLSASAPVSGRLEGEGEMGVFDHDSAVSSEDGSDSEAATLGERKEGDSSRRGRGQK